MEDLAGAVAVVTGGGSGLGRALAVECHRRGMRVVVADVDAGRARETVELLDDDEGAGVACDVTDPAAVEDLARFTVDRFGAVDLLVNNAGILTTEPVPESTLATWRRTIDVNLMGVAHGVLAFVPRMRERGRSGHIVNVASFGGVVAGLVPGIAPYVASKFAVVGMSEQLRFELAPMGIGVTVVCPTYMATPMNRERDRPGEHVSAEAVATQTLDAVQRNDLYVANPTELVQYLDRRVTQIRAAVAAFGT